MEVIITRSADEASKIAARLVAKTVRAKPRAVLGLATGSTPLGLYRELIRLHREEGLDFSGVTTFNLDEYLGLPPGHPASFAAFMRSELFDHINVPEDHIHIPDSRVEDIPAHCLAYEQAIKDAGGIDIQILGIGSDGHIGFNEPSSSLASRTRIKTLTVQTRRDNAAAFGGEEKVPHHVITMGIGTILDSHCCVLLAFGKRKAPIIAKTVEGPIAAMVPASALQLHQTTKVIIDEPAASELTKHEYYSYVLEHKPEWQQF